MSWPGCLGPGRSCAAWAPPWPGCRPLGGRGCARSSRGLSPPPPRQGRSRGSDRNIWGPSCPGCSTGARRRVAAPSWWTPRCRLCRGTRAGMNNNLHVNYILILYVFTDVCVTYIIAKLFDVWATLNYVDFISILKQFDWWMNEHNVITRQSILGSVCLTK